LDGDRYQRPNHGADNATNGAKPTTQGARFHDIAPGITWHEGFEAQRLYAHLPTRLQRFFRIPGDKFHPVRIAERVWRGNDALTTIA
jgi:hypothetical protein